MVIKETNVRPLIVYFYCPDTNKMLFNYIVDEPKEYKNCIFGILDNIFSSVGLPEKIYFNNRTIHSIVSKTLDSLNIENSFLREKKTVDDNINQFLDHIYSRMLDHAAGISAFVKCSDFWCWWRASQDSSSVVLPPVSLWRVHDQNSAATSSLMSTFP